MKRICVEFEVVSVIHKTPGLLFDVMPEMNVDNIGKISAYGRSQKHHLVYQ